jgi:hypothetical protein
MEILIPSPNGAISLVGCEAPENRSIILIKPQRGDIRELNWKVDFAHAPWAGFDCFDRLNNQLNHRPKATTNNEQ